MKSWILPSALVAVTAVAVVGAGLSPTPALPQETVRESSTRVSVVCPSFQTATATVRVAAVGIDQLVRTSKLNSPQKTTETDGLAVVQNPGQPVRVSVPRAQGFGATTASTAAEGPARGLALSSCLAPQAQHWFAGVDVSPQSQSQLVLVNLDSTDAVVDLIAYGTTGRLSAPRGLTVPGASATTVSLGVIKRQADPITFEVSTSQGRVAAFVRQFTWQGTTPYAADWVPDGLGPQTDQVLPGVPGGKGKRTVVVTNPGDRVADVQLGVLGPTGLTQLTDAQNLEVPPGASRSVDLAAGLAGEFAGLHLTSNVPVVAGMLADNGLSNAAIDSAVLGSASALPADAIWPLAAGKSTASVLQLVNAAEQEQSVQVTLTGAKGQGKTTEVSVAANTAVQFKLSKADAQTIRIQGASAQMYASLIATTTVGSVRGIAVLDLIADESRAHQAAVLYDPHLS